MRPILFLPLSVTWFLLPSCGKKSEAPPEMLPAHVTYSEVGTETVTVTRDLPGRIDAVRVAEVRARVPGILLKKSFQEGADVKAGDVLFEIDPAPLQAALDSATASVARAEANEQQALTEVKRFRELISFNAVSKQAADNAESAVAIASADVLSARAALVSASLNLGYATVTAPISGRIGKAAVTEGALVGEGSATLLATIQQLNPIYFDFTQSATDLIAMKKGMAGREVTQVTLLLEDGTEYEHKGKILFSEASVDRSTGMALLRAEFPNPNYDLLPGMFARAKVVQAIQDNATTVPQRAVTRALGGAGSVMVIDDSNVVHARMIQTSEMVGDRWVVTSGLKPGERVIMEGHLKARPGATVVPEVFQASSGEAPQEGAPPDGQAPNKADENQQ